MFLLFFVTFTGFCVSSATTLAGFLQILAVGMAASTAVFFFACRYLSYSLEKEKLFIRISPLLALYALSLVFEVLKAAFAVLKRVYGKKTPEGCILTLHTGIKSRFAASLFANAITLTPGTITVHVEGELFTVHCLEKRFGEGVDTSLPAQCALKIDRIISR